MASTPAGPGTLACTNCGAANAADAKFCSNCGHQLPRACPNCGTANTAGAKFCSNCGFALAAPAPAPPQTRLAQYVPPELLAKLQSARSASTHGERRVVTMLFCDVKGSTAAAERLDPEDWAQIMNGAFERLIAPVYRYEGTLARLMGDAILAFFGAPIAHEDDPQRAVLAGLQILDAIRPYRAQVKQRWDIDFDVRLGINTGLVVVGEVGSDLRSEYTALGDAVNVAARMEQTATPGTVQIADDTYRLVAPLFDVEDLGPIAVKGKVAAVRAYRVIGPKAQPGQVRGIEGLRSPLIGRHAQLAALRGAVDRLRAGAGQVVTVVGEAGIGKSRLVAELRDDLLREGVLSTAPARPTAADGAVAQPVVRWYEGRSFSYEASTPYAPFVDLLSGVLLGSGDELPALAYPRLRAAIRDAVGEGGGALAPFLATVLGIAPQGDDVEFVRHLMPPQVKQKTSTAVADLLRRLTADHPVVLVVDDVHWADSASLELLEALLPLTDTHALMLLLLMRPQRQDASWRIPETAARDYAHRYTAITLDPLTDDDARDLVANLLRIEGLPDRVRSLILAKAEGNPFFVEEVIRSLLDTGVVVRAGDHWHATREVETIAIPNTLAGVLTSRLDRLSDRSRQVAQTAAVLGREFRQDTLAVLDASGPLDEALADLQRRGLLREVSRMPQRVYIFKHALTHDAAYASLLLSARRALHRRAAVALEQAAPEQVNDIARHYEEAQETARAMPYLVRAGEAASRSSATPEALAYFAKALDAVRRLSDAGQAMDMGAARRAFEGLGRTRTFAGDLPGAISAYEQMLAFGQAQGDEPMQASAQNKQGFVYVLLMGQIDRGAAHLESAQKIANGCGDLAGLAEYHMSQCYIHTASGEFEGGLAHLAESTKISAQINDVDARLFSMSHIANTLTYMLRFEEAERQAADVLVLAREAGNRAREMGMLAFVVPTCQLAKGEVAAAIETARSATRLAEQTGDMESGPAAMLTLASLLRATGQYQEALELSEHVLGDSRESGQAYFEAAALGTIGALLCDLDEGRKQEAVRLHAQALAITENPMGAAVAAAAWAEIGFTCLQMGNVDEAGTLFQRGLTVSTGTKLLARPALLCGSALVSLARGDTETAAGYTSEARSFAESHAMRHTTPLISFVEAALATARRAPAQALAALSRCEEEAARLHAWPLLLQAQSKAVSVLTSLDLMSEAQAKRLAALATLERLASLVSRPELRTPFLAQSRARLDATLRPPGR